MSANGISRLSTKEARQLAKLEYSQAKRKGQVITEGSGTWSTDGVDNDTVNWYRANNEYDVDALSLKYSGDTLADDSVTYNPLLPRRPWISGAAAESVETAVSTATFNSIQTNYDAATNTFIKPAGLSSGGTITQWLDQSVYAHNLNSGGSARPIWVDSVKNGNGVLRFDGVNDCLTINPVSWLNGMQKATFFVLVKPTTTTGTTVMGSDQGDLRIFTDSGAWKVQHAGATAQQDSVTTANITANNWYYLTVRFDGTQTLDADKLSFRVNGVNIPLTYSGSVGATTSSLNTEFAVGCYSGAEFFSGDIGELLVFAEALIAPEVTGIETYLADKWDI